MATSIIQIIIVMIIILFTMIVLLPKLIGDEESNNEISVGGLSFRQNTAACYCDNSPAERRAMSTWCQEQTPENGDPWKRNKGYCVSSSSHDVGKYGVWCWEDGRLRSQRSSDGRFTNEKNYTRSCK